ncbi:GTP 3',8-cyclase MoaA [Arcanobacterium phocisimile]|uniref:GTP 3',8-cyclase MoaA n=1 Tax=Arcanobacterium phocisimile TaxID=1302235 RepID=UPI003B838FF5
MKSQHERSLSSLSVTNEKQLGLVDKFGRRATDLRVSLTDRCNLRCLYCMPEEGLPVLPLSKILTDEEVVRLVRIGVNYLGITKVRFTGGEPLLRKGLETIVSECAQLRTTDGEKLDLALTTNGLGLSHRARALHDAGLKRVNISLDSSSREEYLELTRRDRFAHVMEGISAATAAGLSPAKINAVVIPGVNDDSSEKLLCLALNIGAELRFIEHMPIGPKGQWNKAEIITSPSLIERLQRSFKLEEFPKSMRGSSPASLWGVAAGTLGTQEYPAGTVGFISSVSQPFCAECDRTRLTAEGRIRSCLFNDDEYDLRALLRSGASDGEIASQWQEAMWNKPARHGINDDGFTQPDRTMSAIGG